MPVVLIVAVATVGCDPSPPSYAYQSVTGRVTECHPDTGDLTVAPERGARGSPRPLLCVVTADSEIYINDRLSAIERVAVGDPIVIIGYRESNAAAGQLVISYARIQRPADQIAPPAFLGEFPQGAARRP